MVKERDGIRPETNNNTLNSIEYNRWLVSLQTGFTEAQKKEFIELVSKIQLPEGPLEISDVKKAAFSRIARPILRNRNKGGLGYLNLMEGAKEEEEWATAYIAQCFNNSERREKPCIFNIDDFYTYLPERRPSLTAKAYDTNNLIRDLKINENYALIVSGFSHSDFFTPEILERVPSQSNAGIGSEKTELGKRLLKFSSEVLPLFLVQHRGNLEAVHAEIAKGNQKKEEDARLLLVTGLLLQDQQKWQGVGEMETPLYIVAPHQFHEAMNRLNEFWGHGPYDYEYRASNSLGCRSYPVMPEDYRSHPGPSQDEFEERISQLLAH